MNELRVHFFDLNKVFSVNNVLNPPDNWAYRTSRNKHYNVHFNLTKMLERMGSTVGHWQTESSKLPSPVRD
jgi:hypothetical protein